MSTLVFLALAACGPSAASLELNPNDVVIASKTQALSITATGKDAYMAPASAEGATWTSSDPAVATVEAGPAGNPGEAVGVVHGVGSGRAIITASLGEKVQATANVTVNLVAKGDVFAPAFLAPGGTGTIATAFKNEKDETVTATATCTTSDAAVATLADTTLTAVGPGLVKVQCKAEDVSFETNVAVLGPNAAPLAVDPRAADNDYAFVRQSIGLLPEIQKLGLDNVKLTSWTARDGKPRFTYELCGTPAKMDMTLKNFDGDPLPLTITGPCPSSTFAADALPWANAPWVPLLVEADKRGMALAKGSLAITAAASDTWTLSAGGKSLVSKGGTIQ